MKCAQINYLVSIVLNLNLNKMKGISIKTYARSRLFIKLYFARKSSSEGKNPRLKMGCN